MDPCSARHFTCRLFLPVNLGGTVGKRVVQNTQIARDPRSSRIVHSTSMVHHARSLPDPSPEEQGEDLARARELAGRWEVLARVWEGWRTLATLAREPVERLAEWASQGWKARPPWATYNRLRDLAGAARVPSPWARDLGQIPADPVGRGRAERVAAIAASLPLPEVEDRAEAWRRRNEREACERHETRKRARMLGRAPQTLPEELGAAADAAEGSEARREGWAEVRRELAILREKQGVDR